MQLIEWEVQEDNYQEQINIPQAQADQASEEGISTANKSQVTVRLLNKSSGEEYLGRLKITGTRQIYVPTEIQKMLKGSKTIRLQILGG